MSQYSKSIRPELHSHIKVSTSNERHMQMNRTADGALVIYKMDKMVSTIKNQNAGLSSLFNAVNRGPWEWHEHKDQIRRQDKNRTRKEEQVV